MTYYPQRDHGLGGDPTDFVKGTPRVKAQATALEGVKPVCPNCGCGSIYEIEVDLENYPMLKAGTQIGQYLGCPACPWASPMIAMTVKAS